MNSQVFLKFILTTNYSNPHEFKFFFSYSSLHAGLDIVREEKAANEAQQRV